MAHFARIDDNNIVTKVIVAEQDFIDYLPDSDLWIQTSYNTSGGVHYGQDRDSDGNLIPDGGVALRKNYAGIGYTFDTTRDAFISPQTYNSWILNEETCRWESPVPYPIVSEGGTEQYNWDEETTSWLLREE